MRVPIETLRAEMMDSSQRLAYERAAAYRDKLRRLEALREQFGRLRFAVESLSFVYTVPGNDGKDRLTQLKQRAAIEVTRLGRVWIVRDDAAGARARSRCR